MAGFDEHNSRVGVPETHTAAEARGNLKIEQFGHLLALNKFLMTPMEQTAETSLEKGAPMDLGRSTTEFANPMDGMDEIIKEFLVESTEALDRFDRDLIALERDTTSRDLLDSIFRAIHTIKGTGGVLGFNVLVSVSHVGESVLSRMRDGSLQLSPEITTALLAMADALRRIVEQIRLTGNEGNGEYSTVSQKLAEILGNDVSDSLHTAQTDQPNARADTQLDQILTKAELRDRQVNCVNRSPQTTDPDVVKTTSEHHDASANTIRVGVGLLDKVMNLVGELVLARNQVLQFTGTQQDSGFLGTAQRLNLITTELQEGVMKTRMQPIGNIWNKLPRIIRDLSLKCGKQIEVKMEGADTELDKTIIEAIKDPLTHIIRNAVDHGIEMPEQRVAYGKSPQGHLVMRAFHEGGQVNIEISDDGEGIRTDKVKSKAINNGLITAERAARMSEREILNLIFAPGLSTTEQVSNISGRGVGMDVVKTNIERIGGAVDVQSTSGKGTLLKIKIPLTLAIIPALVVTGSGERFAIPQVSLVELVRCEGEQAAHCIENIQGASVYRLRGNLLPLVYLNREMELSPSFEGETTGGAVNIVVLQAGDQQFGLVVDSINDTEEIVVKPLSKQLKSVLCFAGATIMGDGRVALILDVLGLAQKARVVSELSEQVRAGHGSSGPGASGGRESWLLFRIGKDGRMAIPLSLISRLEEFPGSQVERSAGREVIQYRNQIMPLIRLAAALGYEAAAECELLQVIVYSSNGRSVGLVVDEILDITEERAAIQGAHRAETIRGAAVIQQRVTDLLDVPSLLAAQNLSEGMGAQA